MFRNQLSHYEFTRLTIINQFLCDKRPINYEVFRNHYASTYKEPTPVFDLQEVYQRMQDVIDETIASINWATIDSDAKLPEPIQTLLQSAINARAFEFIEAVHVHLVKHQIKCTDSIIDFLYIQALHCYSKVEFEEFHSIFRLPINDYLMVENITASDPKYIQLSLLQCAVRFNNFGAVQFLLANGADIYQKSDKNLSAIEEAEIRFNSLDKQTPCISMIPAIHKALSDHEDKLLEATIQRVPTK